MTLPDTTWMLRAACRGCDPALFFPELLRRGRHGKPRSHVGGDAA